MTRSRNGDTGYEELRGNTRLIQAEILHRIRLDLDQLWRPELVSVEAKASATLAAEMLSHVIAALRDLPSSLDGHLAALNQVNDDAEALLAALPDVKADIAPVRGVASEMFDDATLTRLAQSASARMAVLIAQRRVACDPILDAEVAALSYKAVAAEGARVADERNSGVAEMNDATDPVGLVEVEVTRDRLNAFLHSRFDDPKIGSVDRIVRLAGGYSKDTFAVRLTGEIEGAGDFILRRDLPFGPGENSVIEEFDILRALADAGSKVARPFWCETDESWVGRPFLLFPKLAGDAIPMDWPSTATEEKADVCRQIARQMAHLHGLDPVALGAAAADDTRTPQDVVRDYVRHWRRKWQRRRVHPSLILEIAYDWLEANAPKGPAAVSIVHGDLSIANTLLKDGQVSAILDWEFWHLGDPIEDLSYLRWGTERHVPWETVMAAYRNAGGIDYDPERAKFYEIWRSVRNATTISTAWQGFLMGKYPATKAAYQGVGFYRYCLMDLAEKLREVRL